MPEVARSLMEQGDRAREENRIDNAIAKYRHVIEVAPFVASAYVNLGALYFSQGKVSAAYDTFVRGVAVAPSNRTLLSNAAATALQLGKGAEALRYADDAIARNQRDASLHSLRSSILRSLSRNEEALAEITQATTLAPDDAKYQFGLGNLLVALGPQEKAITAFRKAADLDRTFLRAYFNLGAVLFEAGRYDEARNAYRVALAPIDEALANHRAVEAINARAYANLGAILLKQQKFDDAIDAYQKSASLDEGTVAHYNLGFLFFTTGRMDRAQDEYRKALARDPALPLAYLHLGTIAFRGAKYDDAIKLLHEGLPYFDNDSRRSALPMLGRALLIRGDPVGARTALEGVLLLDGNDPEALLLLGRMARREKRFADAKSLLERAHAASPANSIVTLERALLARETNDLAGERAALTALPDHPALRAELAIVKLRETPTVANLRALRNSDPEVAAVLDALDGNRDAAARALAQRRSALARGNAGLLFWQLGLPGEAKPHLAAAHKAFAAWNEVSLAEGEIALSEKNYSDAAELLSMRCDGEPWDRPAGTSAADQNLTLNLVLGDAADTCGRAKRSLAAALLGQAAETLERAIRSRDEGEIRRARQLADRAAAFDERRQPLALFLRGTSDLVAGSDAQAREALARAIGHDLPPAIEAMARKNLELARPRKESVAPEEPVTSQARRTIVIFLPDTPADTEKKLAESVNDLVNELASAAALPLKTELFRRSSDARAFIAANRDHVGVVIANPELVPHDFSPRYAFVRDGRTTYARNVVVPRGSSAKSLADLRGKTISGCEGLGDDGVEITTRVADDLNALANALYGRTDAALVSESNPLLAEHAADLRILHITAPRPLPIVAFAPMPALDRMALDQAFRSLERKTFAPIRFTGLVRIGAEPRVTETREIQVPAAASLGIRLDRPIAFPLRVSVRLPRVEIPEDLFGTP